MFCPSVISNFVHRAKLLPAAHLRGLAPTMTPTNLIPNPRRASVPCDHYLFLISLGHFFSSSLCQHCLHLFSPPISNFSKSFPVIASNEARIEALLFSARQVSRLIALPSPRSARRCQGWCNLALHSISAGSCLFGSMLRWTCAVSELLPRLDS